MIPGADLAVLAAAAGACLSAGLLPWMSAEVVVAGAVVAVEPGSVPGVVLTCAVAQLAGKTGLYVLARWAPARLPRRLRSGLDRTRSFLEGRPRFTPLLLVASGAVGAPPLLLTAPAAGALRLPLPLFLGAAGAGVLLRTAAVAWAATSMTAAVSTTLL